MVAKTPTKVRRLVAAPPNRNLLREAIRKVDKCMARLQELQFTASGGTKAISGVNLSPRSTRGYLRTSIRCKQESLRLKTAADQISPTGKLPQSKEEWRQMSLPAMLIGETMAEILQTSRFAREIVLAVSVTKEPRTPISNRRTSPQSKGSQSQLCAKRKMEKQPVRSLESRSPKLQRARSRIKFKASPIRNSEKSFLPHVAANRVSPKNKPWVRKTILFPNPLFVSSPSSKQQKFCRTRSPVIGRTRHQTPHKFIIKSPVAQSKFIIKSPVVIGRTRSVCSISPPAESMKRSPKIARLRRSFSPARLVNRLASPLKNRISPLNRRIATQNGGSALIRGLKQRPPAQLSGWKPTLRLESSVGGRNKLIFS